MKSLLKLALEGENNEVDNTSVPSDNTTDINSDTTLSTDNADTEVGPVVKKLKTEDEMVFYGKITNFDFTEKRSSEDQEQYEIYIAKTEKNALKGRIRVRKTTKDEGEPKYVITTKTKLPDGSEYEADAKTTVENFIQFKYLAESGMVKTRFKFKVAGYEGLYWEVDLFKNAQGNWHEWCKIDLEVNGQKIETLPEFPIELTEVITNQAGARTETEEATIRTLYDTVFRVPNPYLTKVD